MTTYLNSYRIVLTDISTVGFGARNKCICTEQALLTTGGC